MIWTLAVLWLFLNFFDVFVSWTAIQLGAKEIGIAYLVSGSFISGSTIKMAIAMAFAAYMIWRKKLGLLAIANVIILGVIIWNIFVLKQLA